MPEVSRNILVITVGVPLTMVGLKPYAKPPFKDKTLVNSDFSLKIFELLLAHLGVGVVQIQ